MNVASQTSQVDRTEIALPEPELGGGMSLAEALAHRRSRREFGPGGPSLTEVGQLCWAALGITEGELGLHTAPSAGATNPVALFAVERAGVYCYEPSGHRLRLHLTGDVRTRLRAAAHDQPCLDEAPLCLVLAVQPGAVAGRYGRRRGWRYALLEAGHVAQNVLLQATALGLTGVPVGAFDDRRVADVLGLPAGLHAVYLVPVGAPIGS